MLWILLFPWFLQSFINYIWHKGFLKFFLRESWCVSCLWQLNGDGDKSGVKNYGKTFVLLEINLIIKFLDFFITASIDHWRREGIRGLWAKIALKHASLVPVCAKVRNHRTIGKLVTTDPSGFCKKRWRRPLIFVYSPNRFLEHPLLMVCIMHGYYYIMHGYYYIMHGY